VLGDWLEVCSMKPMTGFFRDGCCDTSREDIGSRTVCAVMTAAFLEFSKSHQRVDTPGSNHRVPRPRPQRGTFCIAGWDGLVRVVPSRGRGQIGRHSHEERGFR
jgi:uncharacterized protein (DUF2237 family)